MKGSENQRKYVHRIIMEQSLKRSLTTQEIVHHKNGNKSDNRIENLEIMTRAEHASHHHKGQPKPNWWRKKISNSVIKTHWSKDPKKRQKTINKMSQKLKGRVAWNKGIKMKSVGNQT